MTASLDLSDAVVFASSFGGPPAIVFAERHPERVSKLILDSTFARGRDIVHPERGKTLLALLDQFPDAGHKVMGHFTHPDPDAESHERVARALSAIDPRLLRDLYALAYELDVTSSLPAITMPTLVMHREDAQAVPIRAGRRLASGLPHAQFVAFPGTAANPWEGDAPLTLAAMADFLGVELQPPPELSTDPALVTPTSNTPLRIVLFTDLESSTALTQRLGDAGAQEILNGHNQVVRQALADHDGREIKHTGDGIMASFASASAAVRASLQIQRGLVGAEIRVRIGLNAGEPIQQDDDLFGASVQLAARVCDRAEPGQIVVANVVKDLCLGKGFTFTDLGPATLKGFDHPVPLFAVEPSDA